MQVKHLSLKRDFEETTFCLKIKIWLLQQNEIENSYKFRTYSLSIVVLSIQMSLRLIMIKCDVLLFK